MWLSLLFACPAPVAPPEPVTVVEEAPPMAPPTGRAVVRTVRPVTYAGVAWGTAVERATEFARQRAHACYARDPSFMGELQVNITVDHEGRVTDVHSSPTEPPMLACFKTSFQQMRFPAASGEFPMLSVGATWQFEVVPMIDLEHDCVEDSECGLVTGGCDGPLAVTRREAPRVDAEHQAAAMDGECGQKYVAPVFARCVDGACTAVAADLADRRACTSDAGCAVIERWCGWDAVTAATAAESQDAISPERDAIPCDVPRGAAPVPRCVYQQCTLDWAGK
jgi:hypothetical protein